MTGCKALASNFPDKYHSAETYFFLALMTNPSSADSSLFLAYSYYQLKSYSRALENIKNAARNKAMLGAQYKRFNWLTPVEFDTSMFSYESITPCLLGMTLLQSRLSNLNDDPQMAADILTNYFYGVAKDSAVILMLCELLLETNPSNKDNVNYIVEITNYVSYDDRNYVYTSFYRSVAFRILELYDKSVMLLTAIVKDARSSSLLVEESLYELSFVHYCKGQINYARDYLLALGSNRYHENNIVGLLEGGGREYGLFIAPPEELLPPMPSMDSEVTSEINMANMPVIITGHKSKICVLDLASVTGMLIVHDDEVEKLKLLETILVGLLSYKPPISIKYIVIDYGCSALNDIVDVKPLCAVSEDKLSSKLDLNCLVEEVDYRLELFRSKNVSNLDEYNDLVQYSQIQSTDEHYNKAVPSTMLSRVVVVVSDYEMAKLRMAKFDATMRCITPYSIVTGIHFIAAAKLNSRCTREHALWPLEAKLICKTQLNEKLFKLLGVHAAKLRAGECVVYNNDAKVFQEKIEHSGSYLAGLLRHIGGQFKMESLDARVGGGVIKAKDTERSDRTI